MTEVRDDLLIKLREEIQKYLEKHPNISTQVIASRANVGYNTVRRILNGQSCPNLSQVLKILSVISNASTIREILEKYDESITKALKVAFDITVGDASGNSVGETFEYNNRLNEILADPDNYITYCMIATWRGASYDEIFDVMGGVGKRSLDTLKRYDLVELKEDRYFAKASNFVTTPETTKKKIPALVKHYSAEDAVLGRNWLSTLTESVNLETKEKIVAIMKSSSKEIFQLLNDPKNRGNNIVFAVGCVDSIGEES
jgi:hypothetical protein